ncbi:MAG TPA: type II toxin-antitoxin system RelE/ParE family toxin [Phycisphaerales bacterium]|nr:type II toxin-antitoxin system RelE/ParE family toxin [Phycisphaerales bacterium]
MPNNPEIGQKCPEHNREDLRQRLYKKYRMIYQLVGDEVRILQIFHARREKLPELRIE